MSLICVHTEKKVGKGYIFGVNIIKVHNDVQNRHYGNKKSLLPKMLFVSATPKLD